MLMTKVGARDIFLCFLFASLTATSYAQINIKHTCLRLLEQSASDLKKCLVKQRTEDECTSKNTVLEAQIGRCNTQQFTTEDISYAIRSGESEVAGDKNYSPFAKKVLKNKLNLNATRGNRLNFSQQFPKYSKSHPKRLPHIQSLNYDTKGCKNQYYATTNRLAYSGKYTAKRYILPTVESDATTDIDQHPQSTIHYFSRMTQGKCYQPPKENERLISGELKIVNIPSVVLTELSPKNSRTRTIICESEKSCKQKKEELLSWKLKYQKAYLSYKRIHHCLEKESDNAFFHRIHRKGFSKLPLPKYCPKNNIKQHLENQELLVKEIALAIFGPTKSITDNG